jgi:hypothetical protein
VLRLYQELLRLRRTEPALCEARAGTFTAVAAGDDAVVLLRRAPAGDMLVFCRLRGKGDINLAELPALREQASRRWQVLLTTEDAPFTRNPEPPCVDQSSGMRIFFRRPSVVLLRG